MSLHYTTLIPLSVNSVMMPYIHSFCYFSVELLVTEKVNGYLAEMTLSSLRVCLEACLQFSNIHLEKKCGNIWERASTCSVSHGTAWIFQKWHDVRHVKTPLPARPLSHTSCHQHFSLDAVFSWVPPLLVWPACFLGSFLTLGFSAQEQHFLTPFKPHLPIPCMKLSPLYVASSEEAGVLCENVNTENIGKHLLVKSFE